MEAVGQPLEIARALRRRSPRAVRPARSGSARPAASAGQHEPRHPPRRAEQALGDGDVDDHRVGRQVVRLGQRRQPGFARQPRPRRRRHQPEVRRRQERAQPLRARLDRRSVSAPAGRLSGSTPITRSGAPPTTMSPSSTGETIQPARRSVAKSATSNRSPPMPRRSAPAGRRRSPPPRGRSSTAPRRSAPAPPTTARSPPSARPAGSRARPGAAASARRARREPAPPSFEPPGVQHRARVQHRRRAARNA